MNLKRKVYLYVSANGAFQIAPDKANQHKLFDEGYLPVGSVDTVEEAEQLQTMLCRLSREDNETYFLPFPAGRHEVLPDVGNMLEETYKLMLRDAKGAALVAPFVTYKKRWNLL